MGCLSQWEVISLIKFPDNPRLKIGVKQDFVQDVKPKPQTDLRQVMDYSQQFSIFYSGVESEQYFNAAYAAGARNFLVSYEYMKGKGRAISRRLEKLKDCRLFIDSGAFSIFRSAEYADYTNEQWAKRIKEYLEWVEIHKDIIFAIADLDLQGELGIELINEWRRDYFEPFMLRTGIPVCFVWHEVDGIEGWERMCQRYPYVALSLVSDKNELAEIKYKFKIAEKYNTLVQGMGSTRIKILPEFPFYTVDSISWKAGMMYGLLGIWDGKTVRQIKKKDWNAKAAPYIQSYKDITLDVDKLFNDDVEETIRANIYPYIMAESFIRERHKKIIYWQKPKAQKIDAASIPNDFFPSVEWLDSHVWEGYKDYAQKMNINPDMEYALCINAIIDMTMFCNWDNPEYEQFKTKAYLGEKINVLRDIHTQFINRLVNTDDERISDLRAFFESCLKGENDKLLLMGTNFDKVIKERDDYFTEEEYDTVELSQEDVTKNLSVLNLLEDREGAPEIDELDKEIHSQTGIIPYRNDNGVIVGGQKKIGRQKKIYSDKYPKFNCDNCFQGVKCEHYKAGHICIHNKLLKRFDTRSTKDIIDAMQSLVSYNLERTQRAMIMETFSGAIDPMVNNLISQNMQLLNNINALYSTSNKEILKQTRVVHSDGSREDVLEVSNPQEGSILEKMLMSMKGNKEEKEVAQENTTHKVTEDGEILIEEDRV
jgi:hypothetical protein